MSTLENLRYLSFERAESMYLDGRMTLREWNRYYRAWLWSAGRMAGVPALIQDAYWNSRGPDAFYRRINRMRRVLGLPLYN